MDKIIWFLAGWFALAAITAPLVGRYLNRHGKRYAAPAAAVPQQRNGGQQL